MGKLRDKMNEDMQLHGLAPKTREAYTCVLAQAAKHFWKSPDELSNDQWRDYFLYLVKDCNASGSKISQLLCAIQFLFKYTLQKEPPKLEVVRPVKRLRKPKVLSPANITTILNQVRNTTYRTALTLIYACGLRLSECIELRIRNIDTDRETLRIVNGKGNKDRYVVIPQKVIPLLKPLMQGRLPSALLFPTQTGRMIDPSAIQRTFKMALLETGIGKQASIHTLRHSYATHLLEAGVSLPVIQKNLGHASLKTTSIYLHVARQNLENAADCINKLL